MVLTVQLSLYVLKYSSWYCLGHSVMLLRLAGRLHVIWRCPRWPGSNITRSSGGSTAGESDIYFQMRVVSFLVKESVLVQTATLSGDQSTAASRHTCLIKCQIIAYCRVPCVLKGEKKEALIFWQFTPLSLETFARSRTDTGNHPSLRNNSVIVFAIKIVFFHFLSVPTSHEAFLFVGV